MTSSSKLPAFLTGGPKKLLIGGEWLEALSGETFPTLNPSTGETVGPLALGDARHIDRAVKAAPAAVEGPWSRFKPSQQQPVLPRLADPREHGHQQLAP